MTYKVIYSDNCYKLEEDINDWCNLGGNYFQFNSILQ